MKAYSLDLRERIVAAVDAQQGTQAQIAATFSVSYAFVKKLLRQRRTTGSIAPLPHGGGQTARLDAHALQVLNATVQQQPDATLEELADQLQQHPQVGVRVSPATVTRALQQLDWRRKKTLVASERDPVQRAAFQVAVRDLEVAGLIFLEVAGLIFIDEMGVHCGLTRLFARAVGGTRALCPAPRHSGPHTSVIGALGLRGMVAAMSLEGAMDGLAFQAFLEQVLGPELQPGDIVVLDNLSVHRGAWVQPLIEAHGAHLLYLPAYSPDFSPIENCWSKLKAYLRTVAARTGEALDQALSQALTTITAADIRGWFSHCGYEATPK